MEKIVFFSSDARPLYRFDIFQVLALPNKYVVQFRYNKEWIDSNIDLSKIVSQSVVVFYAHVKDDKSFQNVSTRYAKVIHVRETEDTGLVHFFLELGDFVVANIDSNVAAEKVPGKKFVSKVNITIEGSGKWYQIIDNVKALFGDFQYINLKLKDKKGKVVDPQFDPTHLKSYYALDSHEDYSLELAYYNTDESNSSVRIESPGDSLVAIPSSVSFKSKRDNQIIQLRTLEVQSFKSPGILDFQLPSSEDKENFHVPIRMRVNKGIFRTVLFGLLSTFVIVCSALVIALLKAEGGIDWTMFGFAGVIIFSCVSVLHWTFNKK